MNRGDGNFQATLWRFAKIDSYCAQQRLKTSKHLTSFSERVTGLIPSSGIYMSSPISRL